MTPTILEHSKKAVRRAGDCLISDNQSLQDFVNSYGVLHNWRSSHDYPIQSMLGFFRKKAFERDPDAVVARRLKRTPSILAKLKREAGMKLDRMEDIGGIRIITKDTKSVFAITKAIKGGRTRNILRRERDYINNPKNSGYRGIHLVYTYNGSKPGFPCHNIELQIRTKAQHAWATTVEVVGAFTNQGLKASSGSAEWIEFFKLASHVFSDSEMNLHLYEESIQRRSDLIKSSRNLKVLEKLQAYAVSTKHINDLKDQHSKYYILLLDSATSRISINNFRTFKAASEFYAKEETKHNRDPTKDVVLVSTESLKGLKLAYPNYFADTTDFRQRIRRLLADKTLNSPI